MSKTNFIPSKQQEDFFDWVSNGSGSCVLEAVAGSGKTTTLIKSLNLMEGTIFFGAYNKKIAEEIKVLAPEKKGLYISTLHAAGFKIWRTVSKNVVVDEKKCKNIFTLMLLLNPEIMKLEFSVLKLVSFAKQAAVGIASDKTDRDIWIGLIDHFGIEYEPESKGLLIDTAMDLLDRSIAQNKEKIDFDDMIYAPLIHKVKSYVYDWVLIDEAQDSNASRRLLSLSMLKKDGRLVAVGDRHQAIYGFTGADSKALDLITEAVNAKLMPLTVSYRCPKKIIEHAKTYVSHIEAADDAEEGSVISMEGSIVGKVKFGDVILCRLNAPIINMAYDFISEGIPAKVEGRDIGNGLKKLAKRWKFVNLDSLISRVQHYSVQQAERFRALDQETTAISIEDQCRCLVLIIKRTKSKIKPTDNQYNSLINEIESIFADDIGNNYIILSTIHKAKGREWDNVFWLIKSIGWKNMQEWQIEQENNLKYVAATRAKKQLIRVFNNCQ